MSEDISVLKESQSNELPTRRETLTEAVSSLVTIGNSGIGGVILVGTGIIFLAWIGDSLFPLLQDLSNWLFAEAITGKPAETNFPGHLSKLIVPVILFVGLILFLYWRRRRNQALPVYSVTTPAPHEGLIVMLSDYCNIDPQGYESPSEINAAIENNTLDIERVFSGCNWGQTAFVIKFHAPALRELWVVTTSDGSSPQFTEACRLFKFIAGETIRCDEIKIEDYNNIGEVARKISRIFRYLSDLKSEQIISDITGGTSGMSGGMILATLDEGRKIEYVRQRIKLGNFPASEIRERQLIISPQTSFRMARVFGEES